MVRIVAVGAGGPESWPRSLLEDLEGSRRVFHAAPAHPSMDHLRAAGVSVEPLEGGLAPDDCIVVVPASTELADSNRAERAAALERLVQIVDRLLGPGGCPWDREQTHESLKRHLLEEAYEVLDAIDSGSSERLAEELGDLLLQPIMHAQMEKMAGSFDIARVAELISEKLVRRHPHVFGPLSVADSDEVLRNWDRIKLEESRGAKSSILEGVPIGMASLLRAHEVSKRAARVGFEWPQIEAVFDKLHEEEGELREALDLGLPERIEAEIGDLLFTAVNVARWANVEPEEALRKMLNRFCSRFALMEASAGKPLIELSAQEWDELWALSKSVGDKTAL